MSVGLQIHTICSSILTSRAKGLVFQDPFSIQHLTKQCHTFSNQKSQQKTSEKTRKHWKRSIAERVIMIEER